MGFRVLPSGFAILPDHTQLLLCAVFSVRTAESLLAAPRWLPRNDMVVKYSNSKTFFLLKWGMFTLTNVCINVLSMFVRAVRDMGCISTPAIYWQQEVSQNSSQAIGSGVCIILWSMKKKSDLRGISLESSVQLGSHFYWISPNRQELHVNMAPSINFRQSWKTSVTELWRLVV